MGAICNVAVLSTRIEYAADQPPSFLDGELGETLQECGRSRRGFDNLNRVGG